MKVAKSILFTLKQEGNFVKQKTEWHLPKLRYFNLLLVLVITLTGCGVIPRYPPVCKPPSVSDPASAAHVTVARERKFCFKCIFQRNMYIELDGLAIAVLENGQYTKFLVSSGRHTIETSCNMPSANTTQWPFGGILDAGWDWFRFGLSEEFVAGKEYKFLVSHAHPKFRPFAPDWVLMTVAVEKVQSFPNNISLDPSKMVLLGTKGGWDW